jgi:hypothetical protein
VRVFVSSTCYDLLDLRAELFEDLRDLGVSPMFSDIKESDFAVMGEPGTNSIDVCLSNVRSSDLVLVVLSQRYGPDLGPDFGSVSATHAEYREAIKNKIPVRFYVRDRLDGEYALWKRNRTYLGEGAAIEPAWLKGRKDAEGLFSMIDEHKKLTAGPESRNNWFDTFRTSVDLRAHVRRVLRPVALKADASRRVESGTCPLLIPVSNSATSSTRIDGRRGTAVQFVISNPGVEPAIEVTGKLAIESKEFASLVTIPVCPAGSIPELNDVRNLVVFNVPEESVQKLAATRETVAATLILSYRSPLGYQLSDRFKMEFSIQNHQLRFASGVQHEGKEIH